MRTFARRAANTWAGNSREACLGRLRNCCCAVSDSFMKLAQVGSIANKANAADAKSRAADCSVPGALRRNKSLEPQNVSTFACKRATVSTFTAQLRDWQRNDHEESHHLSCRCCPAFRMWRHTYP